MKSFLAKSDRQLGICIRMLNDEGFNDLMIHSEKNAKSRMEIRVYIDTDTPYKDLWFYHLKSRSGIDVAISRALMQKKQFNERKFYGA